MPRSKDGTPEKPPIEINHRWARRALATAAIATSAARLASRQLLGRSDASIDGEIGAALVRELDGMKGIAMKVGQILSYFDGVLPAETHAALRALQRGSRPIAFEALVPVIERAFGVPLDQAFDVIEREAIAAASIGQVHRGTHRGERVAIKIQYPHVRETFEADFARVGPLARVASMATAVDGRALAEELRERVLEECDYLREADHQEVFARAFAGDARVVVPKVFHDRTASAVLTTAWHEGDDFYTFGASATQARKNEVGATLASFAHRSLFAHGVINADPHPGNYLFPSGDAVVFLDFGCVRRFEHAYLENERALALVVLDDRRDRFRDALIRTGLVPHPSRFDFDSHWSLLRHQYAPYLVPHFRFTFDYVRAGMDYGRPDQPNLRHLAIPPAWIWQQRLQFGLHAVLARLDAEGDFRDILRDALSAPRARIDPQSASRRSTSLSRSSRPSPVVR